MNRSAWIVVFIGLAGAACAAAPTPRLGIARLPMANDAAGNAARSAETTTRESLGVDVFPRIAMAGDAASVRVRVDRSALSRSVELSWWSGDGIGGSHLITLDGDRAARRYDMPIRRLDPGHYEVTAVLLRADGTRIRRSTTILVLGR
jgi:hypothetical protein